MAQLRPPFALRKNPAQPIIPEADSESESPESVITPVPVRRVGAPNFARKAGAPIPIPVPARVPGRSVTPPRRPGIEPELVESESEEAEAPIPTPSPSRVPGRSVTPPRRPGIEPELVESESEEAMAPDFVSGIPTESDSEEIMNANMSRRLDAAPRAIEPIRRAETPPRAIEHIRRLDAAPRAIEPIRRPTPETPIESEQLAAKFSVPNTLGLGVSNRNVTGLVTLPPTSIMESNENTLLAYRYTPLAKVIIQIDNDTKLGEYIKAINPVGIIVFVHLNDGGCVTINKTDLTMIKSATVDMIPYSVKTCNYEAAIPHSNGVAIECNRGVCVVQRNPSGKKDETNYIYPETSNILRSSSHSLIAERKDAAIITDDSMMAYPVVSLQDIRANPAIVLQHTEASFRRIEELAKRSADADVAAFNTAYQNLTVQGKEFFHAYLEANKTLCSTRETLMNYAKQYMSQAVICEQDISTYNTIIYNLRKRAELNVELIRYSRVLHSLADSLCAINADITLLNNKIKQDFSCIQNIMPIV